MSRELVTANPKYNADKMRELRAADKLVGIRSVTVQVNDEAAPFVRLMAKQHVASCTLRSVDEGDRDMIDSRADRKLAVTDPTEELEKYRAQIIADEHLRAILMPFVKEAADWAVLHRKAKEDVARVLQGNDILAINTACARQYGVSLMMRFMLDRLKLGVETRMASPDIYLPA